MTPGGPEYCLNWALHALTVVTETLRIGATHFYIFELSFATRD
jgi:hypothetical protein